MPPETGLSPKIVKLSLFLIELFAACLAARLSPFFPIIECTRRVVQIYLDPQFAFRVFENFF